MTAPVQRKSKSFYIASELSRRLASGLLPANGVLPSAREVAKEFSVAVRTADHALKMLASEGKVVRRAGSGTFAIHRRSKIKVACFFNDYSGSGRHIDHWFASPIYTSQILEELNKSDDFDYDMISYYDLQRNNFSPRMFKKYDCIITESVFCDHNTRQLLGDFGKPGFIIGNSKLCFDPLCQFLPDYMASLPGMLKAARLAGVKKCVFCYANNLFNDFYHTAAVLSSWQQDECEFINLKTNLMEAYRLGQTLKADRQTFYICDSDVFAAGFYRAFLDRGLKPGEFAVSGNGNNEAYGFLPLNEPLLTSVDIRRREQMKMLLPLLMERVRTNNCSPDIFRVSTHVVKRKSTFF